MQIDLPQHVDAVAHKKAIAAGFGNDVAAYVAYLIARDAPQGENKTPFRSAYDAAVELGIVGMSSEGPADLATNPAHMEGFGSDNADPNAH